MADLSIGRIGSSPPPRPARQTPPSPGQAGEGYAGSVEPKRYTVISLLGASLGSGVGAPTETRIVDIDTCLMGYQEVNSALQPHADFLISSPAAEKGHLGKGSQPDRSGHQQVEVFEKILHNPQITPQELAREFIEVNAREGVIREGGQTYHAAPTLSAYSSQGISELNARLDQLGERLLKELEAKPERNLLSFFKKGLSGADKIQKAIDQTRVFPSGKGDPYLDLQHFAQNLAAQYPEDPEMQKLSAGVSGGVDRAALASHKGVGQEDGKLVDYTGFGPLGVFLPGGSDNPFSQGLRSHYRAQPGPATFWKRAAEKADQLNLSPEERTQLAGPILSPLGRKIWAHEVSQIMPGLDQYHRTPNLPPQWKEFVLRWVSHTVSHGLPQ